MKFSLLFIFLLLLGSQTNLEAAVHLSNDGTGQLAIVPFYSVANGLETHLKVINSTDQFKVVRVNVRTADIRPPGLQSECLFVASRYLAIGFGTAQ